MRALVTRPREDAEGVAELLRQRGVEVQVEPLLEIVPILGATVDLNGVQALLVTSANGVRALAAATTERALPVLAVGEASARKAREAGFGDVVSAEGDVDSLAALVRHRLSPDQGALLHAAASQVAGDLAGQLGEAGFTVRRVVLYEARPAPEPSPALVAALRDKAIDLALFFSPRTAATFANLIGGASLGEACRAIDAYCLSAAVARGLAPLRWRNVRVAARPEMEALMALVDEDLTRAKDRQRG